MSASASSDSAQSSLPEKSFSELAFQAICYVETFGDPLGRDRDNWSRLSRASLCGTWYGLICPKHGERVRYLYRCGLRGCNCNSRQRWRLTSRLLSVWKDVPLWRLYSWVLSGPLVDGDHLRFFIRDRIGLASKIFCRGRFVRAFVGLEVTVHRCREGRFCRWVNGVCASIGLWNVHVHVITESEKDFDYDSIRDSWRSGIGVGNGFCRYEPVRYRSSIVNYCVSYVSKGLSESDFSGSEYAVFLDSSVRIRLYRTSGFHRRIVKSSRPKPDGVVLASGRLAGSELVVSSLSSSRSLVRLEQVVVVGALGERLVRRLVCSECGSVLDRVIVSAR